MCNNILSKNLEALMIHQSYIYQILSNLDDNEEKNFYIADNNGIKSLFVKNNEGMHIQYSSFINPEKEAEDYLEKLDIEYNRSIYLVIGIGIGNIISRLVEKITKRSKVVCYEKDAHLLKAILSIIDLSHYICEKKIIFVLGENNIISEDQQIYTIVMAYINSFVSKTQIIVLPIYDLNYISFANKMIKMTMEKKDLVKFLYGNSLDDTLVGLDNNLENFFEFVNNPGINDFLQKYGDVYKNKPAIIVASGPSLDKNVKDLKLAQGKALILTCDGSMETLRKNGIRFDMVGSVERIQKTYEAFYENKTLPEDAILTVPIIVHPAIVKAMKNKILFSKKHDVYSDWVNEFTSDAKGAVASSPSVSHMMFGIAKRLGANPIIIIGQDLSYSPEGVSHTTEAKEVITKIDTKASKVFVEGKDGTQLASTYVWKQFLMAYESLLYNHEGTVIDATEGGAKIKGTEIMTLKDAIQKHCNDNIPRVLDLLNQIEIDNELENEALLKGYNEIRRTIKLFNVLRMKASKSKKWVHKSLEILKSGLETEEQLNDIYDCIDFGGKDIPRFIGKHSKLNMYFQYIILVAVYKINMIKSDKFTLDSIEENLNIINDMVGDIHKYSCKAMKMMVKHYDKFTESIEQKAFDNVKVKHLSYILELVDNPIYDIPLRTMLGYAPKIAAEVRNDE
ncbi:MAG: motility associated factor glycosyltransferase family protein [Clostridia bacterium]|nr:motility associated factor glycosyltransferase family protein [Clostridia bacterium]